MAIQPTPQKAIYISGIYCQLGDGLCHLPTTLYVRTWKICFRWSSLWVSLTLPLNAPDHPSRCPEHRCQPNRKPWGSMVWHLPKKVECFKKRAPYKWPKIKMGQMELWLFHPNSIGVITYFTLITLLITGFVGPTLCIYHQNQRKIHGFRAGRTMGIRNGHGNFRGSPGKSINPSIICARV